MLLNKGNGKSGQGEYEKWEGGLQFKIGWFTKKGER